jgi:hypothetical protein
MLERTEKETAKVGLKINVYKSKKMRIAMNKKETLCIHSGTTERVTQFAYLGSIIDNTGGTETDIMYGPHKKGPDSIQRTKQDVTLNGMLNTNQTSHLQYKCESSPTLWL